MDQIRREIKRTVRLDAETDRILTDMARNHEGNISYTVREALRRAAALSLLERQGCSGGKVTR